MKKIIYHSKLYLGESLSYGDMVKMKAQFNIAPNKVDIFLISRSMNENDQLDIFHAKYLRQRYYDNHPVRVYGMAKSKEEALAVIEKIMQECVTARGDANLIAYLSGE